MQYLLSDEEIKAIYKKLEVDKEPENKDVKQDEKVAGLSEHIKRALGLVGY